MHKNVNGTTKKTYTTPHLVVYGTVRELTQKTGLRPPDDGGKRPRVRTTT